MVFQCGMHGHLWLFTDCYGGMHVSSLGNGIFCHFCKGITGCDTSTGVVLGPLKAAQASLRAEHTVAMGDLLLEYLLHVAILSSALLRPDEGRLQGHTAVPWFCFELWEKRDATTKDAEDRTGDALLQVVLHMLPLQKEPGFLFQYQELWEEDTASVQCPNSHLLDWHNWDHRLLIGGRSSKRHIKEGTPCCVNWSTYRLL